MFIFLFKKKKGNDHCDEEKSFDVSISKNSGGTTVWQSSDSILFNTSFISFDEATSLELFQSGSNYLWTVTATKGSQIVSSSSLFQFCIPKPQDVICSSGFYFYFYYFNFYYFNFYYFYFIIFTIILLLLLFLFFVCCYCFCLLCLYFVFLKNKQNQPKQQNHT